MDSLGEILDDLVAEQAALHMIVADRPAADWSIPTSSAGWSVADQIGHLAFFDRAGATSIRDEAAFQDLVVEYRLRATADPSTATLAPGGREMDEAALLDLWRECRAELSAAAANLDPARRMTWFGPPMSARSFLTARLMEAWAHGRDIADALGVHPEPTDRLRHIAQIGVITRAWSYSCRDQQMPDEPVSVALTGPTGDEWRWGDSRRAEDGSHIEGPAEDFCLVVTQRRHVDDTALICTGPAAREWMTIAQAFAGRPTVGPEPRGTQS